MAVKPADVRRVRAGDRGENTYQFISQPVGKPASSSSEPAGLPACLPAREEDTCSESYERWGMGWIDRGREMELERVERRSR